MFVTGEDIAHEMVKLETYRLVVALAVASLAPCLCQSCTRW